MTFPFRTVPSKLNTSVPFTVQFPFHVRKRSILITHWACITNVSQTGATCSSFTREPRIDGCTLPLSSKLHWDTVLLPLL